MTLLPEGENHPMSSTTPMCPICAAAMERSANPFCAMQGQLLCPGAAVEQFLCTACGHGWLRHGVPLELLYNSNVALPTQYVNGDMRFAFVEAHLDMASITGRVVEFGGGPGELADQARRAAGHERAGVVDFVDRVASDTLDFLRLDFNTEAPQIPAMFADTASRRNLFLLSHVVEHLYDPTALLRELSTFTDSVVYIEVPDFGAVHGLPALTFSLNCLEHLHYFTGRSLRALLEKSGFEIIAFATQAAPRMPAIRALCVPAKRKHNAVRDYELHFSEVTGRLAQKIAGTSPEVQVWVWGLSAFMAQALIDLGDQRMRIAGIFDTRYPDGDYMGIPVHREPAAATRPAAGSSLVVCGSTYSAVQKVISAKTQQAFPGAEFFAITF
jgi:hypothetical protein